MKKILILIFSVLLLISSIGCQKEEEKISIDDMMPREVGNYWKYIGSGNEYADFEQKILYSDENKVQVQLINPGTSSAVIYKYSDQELSVVYSQAEFYEEKNILDSAENIIQIIVKGPIEDGTSWTQDGRKYRIETTKAYIETISGNYENCVKILVEYDNQDTVESYYYKPKLGLVYQEYKAGDMLITSSLSEYNVQGYEKQD